MKTPSAAQNLAALFFCLFAASPHAQEAIEEIVVTADFRERPADRLPVSVTVISGDFLEEVAVQHFEELVNVVPNLNWSGDGHRARYFQIRGIGELEQYEGAPNPSVGFLIDDIDFSGIGTVATLFDVESIEVLRGPQGSRYGANALAGLIYVRSREPSAARDGRLQMTVGDDDTRAVGVAFGGALNDAESVLFRLSAQKHESNGFRDNTYLGREDTNGRDETVARARLKIEATDALLVNVTTFFSDIDDGYDAFALDNSYTMLSDKPGRDAQRSAGAAVRLDWSGPGSGILTSLTAYADSDISFGFDADWGNDESWAPYIYDYTSSTDRARRTLSQEFRYVAGEWLVGAYALRLEEDLLTVNQGEYFDPFFDFVDSLDDSFSSGYQSNNVAVFGQRDWRVGERTRIGSGVRVERRTTSYSDSGGLAARPSETMWGGELSLGHDLSDNLVSYASLSRGYKAGGFNLGAVPAGQRNFDRETLWTIEAGIKGSSRGGLRFNAALFYGRHDGQQIRTSEQLIAGDPASFVFFTSNDDRTGETRGLETDVRWQASDRWSFFASLGLLDTKLGSSGRERSHAPRYTLAAGAVYRHDNGFFARLDLSARDAFYFDVSHDQRSRAYELLHARAGFEGESWIVEIWARNLTDEAYAVRGFYFGNEPPDFPNTLYTRLGDPRHVGLTLERRFY